MGNNPCYKRKIQTKINEIAPFPSPTIQAYKGRLSKSEYNFPFPPKQPHNLTVTRSFCHKFNFDESSEKEFKDYYTPNFEDSITEQDRSYFTEEELIYYKLRFRSSKIPFVKRAKRTIKQRIRFTKGEAIGKGAFGIVYLGFNKGNGQLMAIKQLPISKLLSKELMESIEDEIEILKELKHDNVVRFLGNQKSSNKIYLFFEYISGGNLTSLIRKFGILNESLIKRYCKQILEGLEYLHMNGVVHSDVKGPNILVDKGGVCKLTDFGSSRKVYRPTNEAEKEQQVIGTANWMAPEVIKQEGYGRSADIWSFGCTVIEMLTGELPWSAYGNPYSIMFNVAKGNINWNNMNCSDELKDFLGKCLAINPLDRYNCYKLLRHKFLLDSPSYTEMKPKQLATINEINESNSFK